MLKNKNKINPYEYECQRERQRQAFKQLQSIISLANNGGYLFPAYYSKYKHNKNSYNNDSNNQEEHMTWPIRMVKYKKIKRQKNNITIPAADQMLDMPNLSDDWMNKILDWSATGYLTAAIQSTIYLWSSKTQRIQYKINADTGLFHSEINVNCLKWDKKGLKLAYSICVNEELSVYSDLSMNSSFVLNNTLNSTNVTEDRFENFDNVPYEDVDHSLINNDGSPSLNYSTVFNEERFDPITNESMSSYTLEQNDLVNHETSLNFGKKTNCIKVWILNEDINAEQLQDLTNFCGCIHYIKNWNNSCNIITMEWLADGHILITGCSKATITFYRYNNESHKLNLIRVIHSYKKFQLISSMHLSQDSGSRHLAVAYHCKYQCKLKLWCVEKIPKQYHVNKKVIGQKIFTDRHYNLNLSEVLTDIYNSKEENKGSWIIKALAWHPWKISLVCYAVTPVKNYELVTNPLKSWIVLANACRGQVLSRVQQTSCYSCPTIKILSVDTHCMTFSRLTGELLVSASTVYCQSRKHSNINKSVIIVKHEVVVMHSLVCIVDTLYSSYSGKGLFTVWSPDGYRLAVASTDESLRIWNFHPKLLLNLDKSNSTTYPDFDKHLKEENKTKQSYTLKYCRHINDTMMSKLSFHASRVIK
ncbi:uncharacterized protein LOC126897185 isoform X2 [Daktulosphaira vitifoliae]|uniref:uncharacterized protein LOC126897185 isoform X2 n=1 Tax=Daktulosphaira vitifoliae TaxID=58002 RepID=UPI0021AA939E|nr:uncharacterized protein LOC126897185 isoform X2 [Daktulosphaira vitifoliae]XP_050526528.1 uncharacterized protein LOC126897185 isoform X2 [Daktulosphaira vitifoliae]XP_050526529.1 uncharacterized protein LOC126897185 isoform X2 [Daktulosphaira vitifoliae]